MLRDGLSQTRRPYPYSRNLARRIGPEFNPTVRPGLRLRPSWCSVLSQDIVWVMFEETAEPR